ncbi:MAG: hypothetical protein AB1515_08245 [Nitrospirota bacterium]
MGIKKPWVAGVAAASLLCLASAGESGAPVSDPLRKEAHRTLSGTVTNLKDGMLSIRTEEGTVRDFSVKQLEQTENVAEIKLGDRLVLELDENNMIIHVDRLGESTPPHQTVAGRVLRACVGVRAPADLGRNCPDPAERSVTLKLPDGTTQTYHLKMPASVKMLSIEPGTDVVMEIDEDNNLVMDFHVRK